MKIAFACFVFATILMSSVELADARRRDRDQTGSRKTCEQMQERLLRTTGGKRPGTEVEKKAKMIEKMRKRGCK